MHTSDPNSVLWSHTAPEPPAAPPLAGDVRAGIVVIGGGFTGLSAALHAAEAGSDVLLLEAQDAGFGASGRNNGQVIPPYARPNPDDIVRLYGSERGARMNAWVAGDRTSVVEGQSVSVLVDLGGRRILKKNRYTIMVIIQYDEVSLVIHNEKQLS